MSPCIIKWDPPRPSLVVHYRAPLFDILPVTWMRALKACTSIYGSHKAGRVGKNCLVELFKAVVASIRGKTSNFRVWAPWKVLPYSCKVWCSIQQAPFHTVTQGTRDLCLQLTNCWDLKHSSPAGRWRRRNGGGPQGKFERARLISGVYHFFPCVIGHILLYGPTLKVKWVGMSFAAIIAQSASVMWEQKQDSQRSESLL